MHRLPHWHVIANYLMVWCYSVAPEPGIDHPQYVKYCDYHPFRYVRY